MADSGLLNTLKSLISKDDARQWAAVNNYEVEESGNALFIAGYTLVFNENGRLFFVEPRVEQGNAL